MKPEASIKSIGEHSWPELIPKLEPLIYQVRAGDSLGTAFVIAVTGEGDGGRHTMLVTAWHVVQDVVQTDEPLDLVCADGVLVSALAAGPTAIYPVGPPECDTALMLVSTGEPLVNPDVLLPMPLETMLLVARTWDGSAFLVWYTPSCASSEALSQDTKRRHRFTWSMGSQSTVSAVVQRSTELVFWSALCQPMCQIRSIMAPLCLA